MPMFWADFFADTAHVSGSVASTYAVLLGHAWLRGGTLPNDDKQLSFMARLRPGQWALLKNDVMAFWELGEDGHYRNCRLSREWRFVERKRNQQRLNGAHGGRPKSLKSNIEAKPDGLFLETEGKPEPNPLHLHLHLQDNKERKETELNPETEKRQRLLSYWEKERGLTREQAEAKWKELDDRKNN